MQAAVVPAVKARWEIEDVPTSDPGPNQVLIKIHASGLCYTDVHQTNGELPGSFPRILGHEPVGEIVAVGPGVRSRGVGDRVGVPWAQARSEEHTSELQSRPHLVCRLLREKKKDFRRLGRCGLRVCGLAAAAVPFHAALSVVSLRCPRAASASMVVRNQLLVSTLTGLLSAP